MIENKLVEKLTYLHYTIATAESCTGGLVAANIVNVSGASEVFERGFVTYANIAKEEEVGVLHETLESEGAVSESTAKQMALGCAKKAHAEVGLSTTGLAGPNGGTLEKPVGLVYIGCAIKEQVYVMKCNFKGNRDEIRQQTVQTALSFALDCLNKEC